MFAPAGQVPPHVATSLLTATEPDMDRALAIFIAERTRLFRTAYRIVGNVAAAEDVVQEVWLRWQRTNRREVNNPAAFLTTATTHLAINLIQSAGHRHEMLTDSPLAEFVDRSEDPTRQAERTADVEQALGLLMVRLTPAERAAYMLRKGLDYPYRDIARVLRTSVPNARQLVRRAQIGLGTDRVRNVDRDSKRRLVQAFVRAARTGEVGELERLLGDAACPAPRCVSVAGTGTRIQSRTVATYDTAASAPTSRTG